MTGRKGPKEYLESLGVYHQKEAICLHCLVTLFGYCLSLARYHFQMIFGYPVWLCWLFFSFRRRRETARTGKNDTSLGIGQIPTFRALSQSPQWLENSTPLCFPVANEGFCWPPKKNWKHPGGILTSWVEGAHRFLKWTSTKSVFTFGLECWEFQNWDCYKPALQI